MTFVCRGAITAAGVVLKWIVYSKSLCLAGIIIMQLRSPVRHFLSKLHIFSLAMSQAPFFTLSWYELLLFSALQTKWIKERSSREHEEILIVKVHNLLTLCSFLHDWPAFILDYTFNFKSMRDSVQLKFIFTPDVFSRHFAKQNRSVSGLLHIKSI